MKWFRKKPLPAIPPFQPIEVKPVPKAEPSVIVDEVDTTDMSATGIHKAWNRLAGRIKGHD